MQSVDLGIEIGKIYSNFDDGKIRPSRHLYVKILDIIPFNNIDNNVRGDWEEEIENQDWLYSPNTDYFIKGELTLSDDSTKVVYYVRTINWGWFSLGWWAGRLDVDGSLLNTAIAHFGPIEKW